MKHEYLLQNFEYGSIHKYVKLSPDIITFKFIHKISRVSEHVTMAWISLVNLASVSHT